MNRLLLLLVLVGSLAASAAPGARQPNPDFTGHWELDLKASSDPTEMLEAVGANFVIRKLAPRTGMSQNIVQHKDRLEIDRKALIFSEHMTLFFDGRPSQTKDLNQNPVTVKSGWNPPHDTIITVIPTKMADDTTGTMTAQRYLDDKGRCVIEMELKTKTKTMRGRRVFRRTQGD